MDWADLHRLLSWLLNSHFRNFTGNPLTVLLENIIEVTAMNFSITDHVPIIYHVNEKNVKDFLMWKVHYESIDIKI